MNSIAINFYPQKLDPPRTGDYVLQNKDLTTTIIKAGLNVIKETELKQIEKHPSYKALISLGALIVSKPVVQKQVLPNSLSEIKKVGDAKVLVETCHEIPRLNLWLEDEMTGAGRITLISAIKDRIEALESNSVLQASITSLN